MRNDAIAAEALLAGAARRRRDLARARAIPTSAGISLDAVARVRAHAARRCSASASATSRSAQAFGGRIVRARRIMHGKVSPIKHDGRGVFAGLPSPFEATRYHSLVIDEASLPAVLEVTARTADGEIMGVRHRELPIEGVQFHPESILTAQGKALLAQLPRRAAPAGGGVSLRARDRARRARRGGAGAACSRRAFAEIAAGERVRGRRSRRLLVALRTKGETRGRDRGGRARAARGGASPRRASTRARSTPAAPAATARGTFNISTTAAFVVAGAGVPVAKHGNRAASSRSGSIDVLEALGVAVDLPVEASARDPRARSASRRSSRARAHPAMRHVAPVRRALGIRTLMNCMGPLLNPLGVRRQLVGVYDARAGASRSPARSAQLGAERALVVHGSDGLDEITTTGVTARGLARGRRACAQLEIDPRALGIAAPRAGRARAAATPRHNAQILRARARGRARAAPRHRVAERRRARCGWRARRRTCAAGLAAGARAASTRARRAREARAR